jgi:ParB-like chromosome segregation protein Spo0J
MYIDESLADDSADRRLKVSYIQIGKLVPDPRNARTYSKKQVAQIAESISAFGFTNPVITDPEGNIIAGHGRLRAAKELNLAEVPVILLAGLVPRQRSIGRLAS